MKIRFRWKNIVKRFGPEMRQSMRYCLDEFLWLSDEVGTVVMWFAYIISLPLIIVFCLFKFPIDVIVFCGRVRKTDVTIINERVKELVLIEEDDHDERRAD